MDTTLFSVSSMAQGYHIYKDLWDASISEELYCQREAEKYINPFSVAVLKDDNRTKHASKYVYICSRNFYRN